MALNDLNQKKGAVMVFTQQHTKQCTREHDCQLKTLDICRDKRLFYKIRDFGFVEITFT